MSMTPRQKQGIMGITSDSDGKYYYDGPLDGIWGPKSRAAAERFVQDFAGEESKPASAYDGIKHFTHEECLCRCKRKYCDGTKEPERELLEVADEIREEIDAPLIPTSVIRCETWNSLQPGAATDSRHKRGKAMDAYSPGMSGAQLLAVAQKNPRVRYAYQIKDQSGQLTNCVHFDVE